MSDIRFIIISIGLIFSGFLILGIFGHDFQITNIEASEFGECYEYHNDKEPVEVKCSDKRLDQIVFFGIVFAFIASGILALIKGIRGQWDNEVKPEDMVGPGNDKTTKKD